MNWLSLRNNQLNFKTLGKFTDHSRGIYKNMPQINRESSKDHNNVTSWTWKQ